jgi:hypothetical protein
MEDRLEVLVWVDQDQMSVENVILLVGEVQCKDVPVVVPQVADIQKIRGKDTKVGDL